MHGLYSLRRADRSLRLAVFLFLVALGVSYVFAFLMVRTYAGLTPAAVAATYAPAEPVGPDALGPSATLQTQPLELSAMTEEVHSVDTPLLIQDSHVHLLLYAIVAALETAVVLGLDWPAWVRDTVITAAFTSGLLDFAGQWLMKAGWPAFSLLTIGAGWAMALVYLVVLAGTVATLWGAPLDPALERTR